MDESLQSRVREMEKTNYSLSVLKQSLMHKMGKAITEIFDTEKNPQYERFYNHYINKFDGKRVVLFEINTSWQYGQSSPHKQTHRIDATIESQFILEMVSLMGKSSKFMLALVLDPNYYTSSYAGRINSGVFDEWDIRTSIGVVYLERQSSMFS